jgi:hypothetical protein
MVCLLVIMFWVLYALLVGDYALVFCTVSVGDYVLVFYSVFVSEYVLVS